MQTGDANVNLTWLLFFFLNQVISKVTKFILRSVISDLWFSIHELLQLT